MASFRINRRQSQSIESCLQQVWYQTVANLLPALQHYECTKMQVIVP